MERVRRAFTTVRWLALDHFSEPVQPGHLAWTLGATPAASLADPVDCRGTGDR